MAEVTRETVEAIQARSDFGSANWDDPITDARSLLTFIAQQDVHIAALESETESGEALVRARHYQGLCEELRGKVAAREDAIERVDLVADKWANAGEIVMPIADVYDALRGPVPVSPQSEETR